MVNMKLNEAYENLGNERGLTEGLEDVVDEAGEDEHEEKLEQEERDREGKWVISQPEPSGVDFVNRVANEVVSEMHECRRTRLQGIVDATCSISSSSIHG